MIGLTYFIYFVVSWLILITIEVVMTKRRADYNMTKLIWLMAVVTIFPAVIVPIVSWFHYAMFIVYIIALTIADGFIKPKLLPWALKD